MDNFWTGALVIILSALGYGVIHSLLASLPAKAFVASHLGAAGERGYRLAYNIFSGILLLPVLAVTALFRGEVLYSLDGWLLAAALAGQAVALLLLFVAFLQSQPFDFLGLAPLLGAKPASGELHTGGAYAIVRHPLYILALAILWLMPALTMGTLALNLAFTAYVLVGSELEEKRLLVEFGEAYRSYQRKTARFIPFVY